MNEYTKELSDAEFARLSEYIHHNYGIKLPYMKKNMLQARLQKRLLAKKLPSFEAYCKFVFSAKEGRSEIIHMIDAVTTNKTDFFREPAHFDFLQNHVLPEFQKNNKGKALKVWSSACSSGEEVYTLAIIIQEYLESSNAFFDYSILGTDLSTKVLEKAINAVYSEDRIEPISLDLRKKYLLRSKNSEKKEIKINKLLRSKANYLHLNLMDTDYNSVPSNFDIIFCRNVLIYFDRETQEAVIGKLCGHLKAGGYLFLGHSESIMGMNLPFVLKQIKPTIYQVIA